MLNSINKHHIFIFITLVLIINANKLCKYYVIDTIMGTELRSQEGKSLEYVEAINTYVWLFLCHKWKNCVVTYSIYFIYFRVTDITIKRIFKFWLWNESIFNLSQNGRDFKKSLKILHTFTENVSKNKK